MAPEVAQAARSGADPLRRPRAQRVGLHHPLHRLGRGAALRRGGGRPGRAFRGAPRWPYPAGRGAAGRDRRAGVGPAGGRRTAAARGSDSRLRPPALPARAIRGPACCSSWPGSSFRARASSSCSARSPPRPKSCSGELPTIDCGLVLVARLLALPRDAALTLFGLGRAAGWIGHAREQYASKQLIRPRARYVGEPPRDS